MSTDHLAQLAISLIVKNKGEFTFQPDAAFGLKLALDSISARSELDTKPELEALLAVATYFESANPVTGQNSTIAGGIGLCCR